MDTADSDQDEADGKDKPSKSECDTAIKILEQYDRLAQKFGLKLSANKLKELNNKRATGTITIYDLPARLREKFPSIFTGMTLSEIRSICGKAK